MKRSLFVLFLFIVQNYLITNGSSICNKLVLPFLIFFVSALILVWFFRIILTVGYTNTKLSSNTSGRKAIMTLAGVCSMLLLYPLLQNLFISFSDPTKSSDVIPQLTVLYDRFKHHIQPYYPLEQYSWHPFPVYMPLHWLPVGLAYLLNIDVRWIGYIFLLFSAGIAGYFFHGNGNLIKNIVAIILSAFALFCFIHWAGFEIAVSYELIIAAYYLLLCAGLLSGNLILITLGIIACLLSRYTIIFWLPLFQALLWMNESKKKNILVWLSIILAVLLFYILPFYLKDPSIFQQGLAYHNKCYVDTWYNYGDPDHTTAFDKGLNFSYYIKNMLSGDMYHRVFIARMIQGSLMLLLLVISIVLYKKWSRTINYHHFSLGMLYCFLLVFFMFSPYTFLYYYLPLQVISAVICGRILISDTAHAINKAVSNPIR